MDTIPQQVLPLLWHDVRDTIEQYRWEAICLGISSFRKMSIVHPSRHKRERCLYVRWYDYISVNITEHLLQLLPAPRHRQPTLKRQIHESESRFSRLVNWKRKIMCFISVLPLCKSSPPFYDLFSQLCGRRAPSGKTARYSTHPMNVMPLSIMKMKNKYWVWTWSDDCLYKIARTMYYSVGGLDCEDKAGKKLLYWI